MKELLLAAAAPADEFVLYNATVLPVANASKRASALCVSKGKVVEVGDDASVLNSACGNASQRLGPRGFHLAASQKGLLAKGSFQRGSFV